LTRNASAPFDRDDLADPASAARALLGAHLVRISNRNVRKARIVETEAYWEEDPASHSFGGVTARTRIMFGPPGSAYVYRIHRVLCLNVVVGPEGRGEAVLLRAIEPIAGIAEMEVARASQTVGAREPRGVALTNGPGKLCQALDVTMDWYGTDLIEGRSLGQNGRLVLEARPPADFIRVGRSPRIGVSKAKEEMMRFYIKGNPWVSPRKGDE